MADDEDIVDDELENEEAAPAKKGGKLWLWIVLLLIILGGGGGAAWFFLMAPQPEAADGEASAEASTAKPHYLELQPSFIVNLDNPDMMRFLQVDVQLMARDSGVLSDVEEYMPQIRNRLLLLMAQQKFEDLIPRGGKEALQKAALEETNAVLKENGISDAVDALYFTSFVMQ